MKKSSKELNRDIAAFLSGDTILYWPGGSGGGGSRKRVPGNPVVRPHARTYSCRRCGQFHTTEEHELEAAGDQEVPMLRGSPSRRSRSSGKATPGEATRTTHAMKPTRAQARPSPPVRSRLAVVAGALKDVRGPGRFGDRKVFVAALWRRVRRKLGMSFDEFKQWLFSQHRAGALQLARADLVGAMDPKLVASSEDTRSRRRVSLRRRSGTTGVTMRNKSDAELAREIAEFLAQAPPGGRRKLPRYNARRGVWRGGDSRTLYAFIGHRTGEVFVRPGGGVINVDPEVTVRMATRDEAEREWQNPLHPGWKVVG